MFTARVSRRSEYLGIEVETYGTLLMWIRSYAWKRRGIDSTGRP
jgi:hypothetical protein